MLLAHRRARLRGGGARGGGRVACARLEQRGGRELRAADLPRAGGGRQPAACQGGRRGAAGGGLWYSRSARRRSRGNRQEHDRRGGGRVALADAALGRRQMGTRRAEEGGEGH